MKDARRQGKRDALAGYTRFKPAYWLDRDNYNKGYDEGLAQLRMEAALAAEQAVLKLAGLAGMVFKHVKTGGVYSVVCEAQQESTLGPVVVYKNVDTDEVWVRPREEFLDGRFEALS